MVEEDTTTAATSPAPADAHKRKLDDLEQDGPQSPEEKQQPVAELDGDSTNKEAPADDDLGGSDAKRPRLDDDGTDELASQNGNQTEHDDSQLAAEDGREVDVAAGGGDGDGDDEDDDDRLGNVEGVEEKSPDAVAEEPDSTENEVKVDAPVSTGDETETNDGQIALENIQSENAGKTSEGVNDEQVVDAQAGQQDDFMTGQEYPESGSDSISRTIEVPNNKVGVLIGKGGDTIRFLQYNSGAKIQITRDADANLKSSTRPLELTGTLESVNKAEKLIKDVIAEADAGGSPALVARGFTMTVAPGAVEQVEIHVPNDKVGFIIGKGGETIKSLQTRSGARIQLIPQHASDGDQHGGRTIRVSGDRKQIEIARELIKEAMTQPARSSQSGNYSHQAHRARGPDSTSRWGNRHSHADYRAPYEYQNRGHYPSQSQHYSPYGGHNPRSSYGSSWEQQQQGVPHSQTGGYNYYAGQGHRSASNITATSAHMGPPYSQANYNHGPPRGPDYGHQPTAYSQTSTPQQQTYGQAQNLQQQQYGGHPMSQPGNYSDPSTGLGYGYPQSQQQYSGPVAPYGMPSQGAAAPHSYAPAVGQAGNIQQYQTPVPSVQSYAQNVPPQQGYPFASSGYAQAPYGSAPAPVSNDGYNQVPQAAATYPQQGYAQPVAQTAYPQAAPVASAYGQYPSAQQQAYGDQVGAAAGYGYPQVQVDPAYAAGQVYNVSAAMVAPQGYAQPAAIPVTLPALVPSQASYDQSGVYTGAPAGAGATAGAGTSADATAPAS